MTPAHQKLSIARSRLLLDHPFFGVLSLRMQLVEAPNVPTLAVDGRSIFFNPDFVMGLEEDLCVSAIAHEVMHPALDHMYRRNGRNARKWNVACDYAANLILQDAGLLIGPGWLCSPAYRDMSAEQIYEALPDGDGDGKGGEGGLQPQDQMLQPPPSVDGELQEDLEVEWKLATVQAARVAKGRGDLPEAIKRLLKDALTPPIPWKDVLSAFMTERIKDDYSWRRPNPYYSHSGVYLPVMDGIGMGEVVIALDTSGSVASVLDEFGSTVKDILNATAPLRVHVVYCDATVNQVSVFSRGQEVTFEAVGGGGTDFRPVFDYVRDQGIRPACLLYLTDMYGHFPQEAPDYPVMWCATSEQTGPFGETLRIK